MALIPRILPVAQRPIVDVPHTAEGLVQVFHLIRRRVEAVTIGAIGHSQIIHSVVNLIKQQLIRKATVLAGGPLSLPGMNAGVSRGES